MLRRLGVSEKVVLLAFGFWSLALLALPSFAHKTEVVGDVAGTWHIDPNHNPKAGDSSRVWIALTQRGGKILPLAKANCQLAVFNQPRKSADKPLLQPGLTALNVERYQGIPAANVTFPKIGLYQLELRCSPKTKGEFEAFTMKYDVTVAR